MIKLTLRLPNKIHERLKQKAHDTGRSLNSLIVDALREDSEGIKYLAESKEDRVWRFLKEEGLWEPLGAEWRDQVKQTPILTHAELRQKTEGVPSLSDAIIEEREPRK
jgi:hypothetical protein